MMNRSLVYVVGLVPGGAQYLTAQAQTALQAADVLAAARQKGLLCLTAKTRLRLLPPLILTEQDVDKALDILGKVLAEMG